MINKQTKYVLSIFAVVLILFIGCDFSLQTTTEEKDPQGSLIIDFDYTSAKSVVMPDITIDIDSYLISGEGPDGKIFEDVSCNCNESVTIRNLSIGEWTINVQALNENGDILGEETKTVNIEEDKETSSHLSIHEFEGQGTLSLEIDWAEENITEPNIVASLCILNEKTRTDIDFIINSDNKTATYSNNFQSGYYLLNIIFYDGSTDDSNNIIDSKNYTVRIAKDKITKLDLELANDSFTEQNDEITDDSFSVSLDSDSYESTIGDNLNISASTDVNTALDYYWYLDEILLNTSSTNSISLNEELTIGTHTIKIIADNDGLYASDSAIITTNDADSNITIKIINPEDNTIVHESTQKYCIANSEQIIEISSNNIEILEPSLLSISKKEIYPDSIEYYSAFSYNQELESIPTNLEEFTPPNDFSLLQSLIITSPFDMVSDITYFANTGINNSENIYFYFGLNDNVTLSINESAIGERIVSNITVNNCFIYQIDSISHFLYKNSEYFTIIGNYNIEISINAKRGEDLTIEDLIFDSNGGNEEPENRYYFPGDIIDFPTNLSFTKEGYHLVGWNTKADGTGSNYGLEDKYTVKKSETTLYAVWALD
ncbi:MAG: InlB B-repeat-containing protein [Pleomorphochaeta sp.]